MIDQPVTAAEVLSLESLDRPSETLRQQGFTILSRIYSDNDIEELLRVISKADHDGPGFRKTAGLFAIRRFFKEIPEAAPLMLNEALRNTLREVAGEGYFAVKSIYFDKPQASNWFVSYHQDLSISVDRKAAFSGFGPWTVKQDQFAVQPPLPILEDNITVRIHLDYTSSENGALRVVPGSHNKGIYRPETIDWSEESEVVCEVSKGGIMLMRPLLLHASHRSTNDTPRRVVHIEFSRSELPNGLKWAEKAEWLNR